VIIVLVVASAAVVVGPSGSSAKNHGTGGDEEAAPIKKLSSHGTSSYPNVPDRLLTEPVKWLSAQLR
jgi:hypothetical protein